MQGQESTWTALQKCSSTHAAVLPRPHSWRWGAYPLNMHSVRKLLTRSARQRSRCLLRPCAIGAQDGHALSHSRKARITGRLAGASTGRGWVVLAATVPEAILGR
jgi:hypothetical protein